MYPRVFLRVMVVFNLVLIVVSIVLGLVKTGNPSRYFGEGRYTTFFSAAQLLAVGVFSWLTFRQRSRAQSASRIASPGASWQYYVWLLVALGFAFLAVDEIAEVHERMDRWILQALALPHTPVTNRLDDLIMASFGLMGISVLWICRKELRPFWPSMRAPMIAGFMGLFLMVLCDTAAQDDHFFLWLTGDLPLAKKLNGWFSAFEGALTLLPEGLFMAAFYAAWHQARQKPQGGNSFLLA
jgi:hypothetical protein